MRSVSVLSETPDTFSPPALWISGERRRALTRQWIRWHLDFECPSSNTSEKQISVVNIRTLSFRKDTFSFMSFSFFIQKTAMLYVSCLPSGIPVMAHRGLVWQRRGQVVSTWPSSIFFLKWISHRFDLKKGSTFLVFVVKLFFPFVLGFLFLIYFVISKTFHVHFIYFSFVFHFKMDIFNSPVFPEPLESRVWRVYFIQQPSNCSDQQRGKEISQVTQWSSDPWEMECSSLPPERVIYPHEMKLSHRKALLKLSLRKAQNKAWLCSGEREDT